VEAVRLVLPFSILLFLSGCTVDARIESGSTPKTTAGHIVGIVASIDWYNKSFVLVDDEWRVVVMQACNKEVPVWVKGKFDIHYTYHDDRWDPCETLDSVRQVKP
jgi:hypothetical protein